MATGFLVGTQTSSTGNLGANFFQLCRFQASATGVMTEIRTYGTVNGEAKVALYADSGGEPGALIVANNVGQALIASQWNTLSIPQANIVSGTYYWLAFNMTVLAAITAVVTTGDRRYKAAP